MEQLQLNGGVRGVEEDWRNIDKKVLSSPFLQILGCFRSNPNHQSDFVDAGRCRNSRSHFVFLPHGKEEKNTTTDSAKAEENEDPALVQARELSHFTPSF